MNKARPNLGLASAKPNLKELAAEKLVSFTCKVNPDEVQTQKILYTHSTRRTQETLLLFFLTVLSFFRRWVIYYRQEQKDRNVL